MKKHILISLAFVMLSACSTSVMTQGQLVISEPVIEVPVVDVVSQSSENEIVEVEIVDEEVVEEVPVEEAVKLSAEEVAKAVIRGEFGNGEARIANVEAAGYDYSEIQKLVNQLTPKKVVQPAPVPATSPVVKDSANEPAPVVVPQYKANRVYMKGGSMPIKVSNYKNQTADIDGTRKTWVTSGSNPDWTPYDNKGTYFAQHNYSGGDILFKLREGDAIIVTDKEGKPYTYIVDKIIRNNMVTKFNPELRGDLDKEYLIFQTCEYTGGGNIHVFATIKAE